MAHGTELSYLLGYRVCVYTVSWLVPGINTWVCVHLRRAPVAHRGENIAALPVPHPVLPTSMTRFPSSPAWCYVPARPHQW